MLDVVLYRRDRQGRLVLQERRFRSLAHLGRFFRSGRSSGWEWAEVERAGPDGHRQFDRHEANEFRGRIVGWAERASRN